MLHTDQLRALYMEDDSATARLVQKKLEGKGYVVDIAHDGVEGVELCDPGRYDVVIVDYQLPRRNGIEVIEQLKLKSVDAPIIMLTGTGNEVVAVKALRKGASDYIVKDIDNFFLELLVSVIEQALERQRLLLEKKKAEAELLNSRKLDSVGTLAGGIAHDFNNLLNGIFGYMELAKSRLEPTHEAHVFLEKADRVFGRAKTLTQQLLTFSKGGNPVTQVTAISSGLRNAIELALMGSNVSYQLDCASDLWECEIDDAQFSQAVHNIVTNASQAMEDTGGEIQISSYNGVDDVSVEALVPGGQYVTIEFRDHGCGISKEHMYRIFDPFFTTRDGATGLGLAIAYSIVKKHRGHISVDSTLGVGTVVRIFLPAIVAKKRERVNGERVNGSRRILLMDDERFILEMAHEMLEMIGYEVDVASNGKEAIELYRQSLAEHPFDAVMLDLTIPGGMGGKQTIQELRNLTPDVKAVVFSGYSDDPVLANPRGYGFRAVIQKPFRMEELKNTLANVFGE